MSQREPGPMEGEPEDQWGSTDTESDSPPPATPVDEPAGGRIFLDEPPIRRAATPPPGQPPPPPVAPQPPAQPAAPPPPPPAFDRMASSQEGIALANQGAIQWAQQQHAYLQGEMQKLAAITPEQIDGMGPDFGDQVRMERLRLQGELARIPQDADALRRQNVMFSQRITDVQERFFSKNPQYAAEIYQMMNDPNIPLEQKADYNRYEMMLNFIEGRELNRRRAEEQSRASASAASVATRGGAANPTPEATGLDEEILRRMGLTRKEREMTLKGWNE